MSTSPPPTTTLCMTCYNPITARCCHAKAKFTALLLMLNPINKASNGSSDKCKQCDLEFSKCCCGTRRCCGQ